VVDFTIYRLKDKVVTSAPKRNK